MVSVQAFIDRWKTSGASERANFPSFIHELCNLLGLPRPDPATDRADLDDYTFEGPVTFDDGEGRTSTGFIDLYRCDCFVMEAKQGRDRPQATEAEDLGGAAPKRKTAHPIRDTRQWGRMMEAAKNQARRYALALPDDHGWPPFLLVVDVGHCFDLFADFSRQGKHYLPFPDPANYRIFLDDLHDTDLRERLRLVWADPMALDRTRQSARVTRRLAARLAKLAASLEQAGRAPDAVAHFLMRCLFTMFAEDVGLLPERAFTDLLHAYRPRLHLLPNALQSLWQTMDKGGFSPDLRDTVAQFNGSLFAEADALPVSEAQLDLLIEAAEADWEDVEPAIFGTLLERALDPRERHKLGAHFTPRAYVERLVMPTIVEPLREAWAAAQTAAAAREAEGDEAGARQEIATFHRRLCAVRVLDPACGSGNFLYVTLEHLKRLEGEVLETLRGYGGQQMLDMTGGFTVSPAQLLGLEINPRAAAIADVVLWIGYLQWYLRTTGDARRLDPPLLKKINNIRHQDAVLAYDEKTPRLDAEGQAVTHWDGRTTKPHSVTGQEVPDETARLPVYDYTNPRPAAWPAADFIVGNPPYLGARTIRPALGDGYLKAIRKAYPRVPGNCDYVMYWWHKAANAVRSGQTRRFGLITTNSITQPFSQKLIKHHFSAEEPFSFQFAIPDHPWVDAADGADVRVALTICEGSNEDGTLLTVLNEKPKNEGEFEVVFNEAVGQLNPDLRIGVDVLSAQKLASNRTMCCVGYQLSGLGFVLNQQQKNEISDGNEVASETVIKPLVSGRDLTGHDRGLYAIDLYGLTSEEVMSKYPPIFQWMYERVKPERDQNNRESVRRNWWIYGEARSTFRPALEDIERLFVTPITAKHRFFVSKPAETVCDSNCVMFALSDAFYLGVLSSRIHIVWALILGGKMGVGNDPRYLKAKCFDPFPFPAATEAQKDAIRRLAEQVDAHRKARLAAHPSLTMTALYNVLATLRAGQPLTDKEKTIHDQGLVGLLQALHDDLDAAVAAAYGWPANLPDEAILEHLVALNHARAAEEALGRVRYLRPAYQNPEGAQQTALAVEAAPATPAAAKAARQPWPKTLPERIQAVQRLLSAEARPVAAAALTRRFHRAQTKQVQALLETLEALGHVRRTDDGRFVV